MKGKGAKKLDIRVQKTYDKLYKTFFELLEKKPYESITVLEICNETGVHRATFYKHFIDKQDFVNFCINKKLDELNLHNDESFFETGTRAYYIDMCEEIIGFIYENKQLMSDLNSEPSSSAFSQALENAISDYIEKRLVYTVSKGIPISSPVHLLSCYYAGAIVALIKAWASDWEQYTKEDILKFISLRYNELDYSYKHNKNFLGV